MRQMLVGDTPSQVTPTSRRTHAPSLDHAGLNSLFFNIDPPDSSQKLPGEAGRSLDDADEDFGADAREPSQKFAGGARRSLDGGGSGGVFFDKDGSESSRKLSGVIFNADEVARCMRLPDQQLAEWEEEARVEIAANTVQKRARAFLGRRRAAWQRCEAEAAARIVRGWRSRQNLRDLRARLARDRAERDATWRATQADFGVRWGEMRWEPRIIVHVPSLSYSGARAGDSLDLAMCRDEPFVTRHRN